MQNGWLGALPGLMLGAASLAKQGGMFGGGLTAGEQAQNNAGWANMGNGRLPDGSENTAMTGAPMQLPGAAMGQPPTQLPGAALGQPPAAPPRQLPPQANPQAFAHAFGGLSGGLGGGAAPGGMGGSPTLPAFAAAQPMGQPPQMPQLPPQAMQPPGLLSDPNEAARRQYLQGIGPAMNIGVR